VVGDEDHSIYRWRGGMFDSVKFSKDLHCREGDTRERIYRSTQKIEDSWTRLGRWWRQPGPRMGKTLRAEN